MGREIRCIFFIYYDNNNVDGAFVIPIGTFTVFLKSQPKNELFNSIVIYTCMGEVYVSVSVQNQNFIFQS